jgi:signal transduction histidine kinase
MSKLIDDLLSLSRLGTIPSDPEDVDAVSLAREVVEDLQGRLDEAGATLTIQADMPLVRVVRSRLGQLLDNLLSNAIKYACNGPESTISIGAVPRGDQVHLFVRDNGPGIAKEYHERIFGPFQRLQSTGEGTGVGLAIVRRIAEALGGRAWVESEPGKGATFWISLPAAVPSATMGTHASGPSTMEVPCRQ